MNFLKKPKSNGNHIEALPARNGKVDTDDLSKVGRWKTWQRLPEDLKVGEILLKLGKITQEDLSMAISKQNEMRKKNAPITQILHDLWRVNFNKNKESVRQRGISIDAVDIHMRKVGC